MGMKRRQPFALGDEDGEGVERWSVQNI